MHGIGVRRHRRSVGGRLALACCAVAALLPAACSQGGEEARKTAAAPAAASAEGLFVAGETFRVLGAIGLLKGLRAYGTPAANLRMKALAGQFFTTDNWEGDWQLFLATALTTIARADSDAPLIGYYHPYSDTMLLTGWKKEADGRWRIQSAEVLPGAVVRGEPPPWSLARRWRMVDRYPPEALAEATAATTAAFARRFGGRGDPLAAAPADARAGMAALAAAPFEDFRAELAPVYAADGAAADIVRLWGEVREEADRGRTARTGDIAAAIAALSKAGLKVRGSLTPVAYVASDKAAVLMLASQVEPGLVVALKAQRGGGGAELVRLDLVSLRAFAEAAAKGAGQ